LAELGAWIPDAASGLIDLLFPPRCLVCDRLAEPFCASCRAQIVPAEPGWVVPDGLGEMEAVGLHGGTLREAVLRLKFGRKVAMVEPLAGLLAELLAANQGRWKAEALVPVPLHWSRQWERGFNQAELLARAVGRRTGLPCVAAVRRCRRTLPQVGQTGAGRRRNLARAFSPAPGRLPIGARVIIVDDVSTTGTTMSECAAVLRAQGASEVFGLAVTLEPHEKIHPL
jgi:ComF family protein